MAWLLLGYDVESAEPDSPVTRQFVDTLRRTHGEHGAPATLFLRGQTLERNVEAIRSTMADGLFDYGQHTYSHVLFKTLWQINDEGERIIAGGSLEEIAREVDRAGTVIRELLGVEAIGLTTPWGYYRGLGDRPELLAILHGNGIRFVRSWMRNERDWVPVPLEVQPFFYVAQGYPDILELPVTGRHDCDWGNHLGFEPGRFDGVEDYAKYVAGQLDEIAARDWAFVYNQHDTTTVRWDPGMVVVGRLIERARRLGVTVGLYRDYYRARRAAASAMPEASAGP
ncbi:MAG: polysaccharide deacetylase family protein [Armatimonadota bacterium]